MSDNSEQELDWVNLPRDCEVESLWECLHDGVLVSCRSDPVNRVVTLEFKVSHLTEEPNAESRFFLLIHNVRSARANVYFRWPGEVVLPEGASREEQSRLIKEYQAKWREESIGWLVLEGALSTDPLQIYVAELARRDDKVALNIGGQLDGARFDNISCSVFVRGDLITASRSDGEPFSLEQFREMGRRYWERFSRQRKEPLAPESST